MLHTLEPTPSSEKSIYFDAPLAHFHMSVKQDPDQPILYQDGTEPAANLGREPSVAVSGNPDIRDERNYDYNGPQDNQVTAHPNGSEGWLPATDLPPEGTTSPNTPFAAQGRSSSLLRKKRPGSIVSSSSVQRTRSNGADHAAGSLSRSHSLSKRSTFTNSEGRPITGSAFINGAGVTGPAATALADDSLHQRTASADATLTPKQKTKLAKSEAKDGKRLSKIIKQEGKVEKQALTLAVNELSELQKIQQNAIKRESKAHTAHTRALTAFQKAEAAYLAARTKYETTQAEMNAEAEVLDVVRNNAREATEKMQEKSQEVDSLRQMLGVDEREREVKLGEINGKPKSRWRQ